MGHESELQDRLFVERCLSGSRSAWDEFYGRFLGLVRKVVHMRYRCGDDEIQDMVQNVFLELFKSLSTYDHQYPLSKFVWVVGERVCIDEFRKKSAGKRTGEKVSLSHVDLRDSNATVLVSDLDPVDDQIAALENSKLLKQAFGKLGEKCRNLLRLRYLQELSFKEIVPLLGVREKTLAVQAGRCIDDLRAHYARVEREGYAQ